jgi:uncharacterized protein
VAEALRQALAARPAESAVLIKQHSEWRAQLARCGVDKKCIDDALWRRVSDIVGR